MRKILACAAVLLLAVLSAACMGATPQAKMQETARDLNMNARFGRMELVVENVHPTYRQEFVRRHRPWGGKIRVADTELVGMKFDDKIAETTIAVSWYDIGEEELRGTILRQKWKTLKNDWMLDSEERMDGDPGLFGEYVPRAAPKQREAAQFPTIRITN